MITHEGISYDTLNKLKTLEKRVNSVFHLCEACS